MTAPIKDAAPIKDEKLKVEEVMLGEKDKPRLVPGSYVAVRHCGMLGINGNREHMDDLWDYARFTVGDIFSSSRVKGVKYVCDDRVMPRIIVPTCCVVVMLGPRADGAFVTADGKLVFEKEGK